MVLRNIICIIFLFLLFNPVKAQFDSSSIYMDKLTGGSFKDWFTRPVVIDSPRELHKYSTLTFKLNPRLEVFINQKGGI